MRYLPTRTFYLNPDGPWNRYFIPEADIAFIRVTLDSDRKGFIEAGTKSDAEWCPSIANLDGTKDWKQVLAEAWIEL